MSIEKFNQTLLIIWWFILTIILFAVSKPKLQVDQLFHAKPSIFTLDKRTLRDMEQSKKRIEVSFYFEDREDEAYQTNYLVNKFSYYHYMLKQLDIEPEGKGYKKSFIFEMPFYPG